MNTDNKTQAVAVSEFPIESGARVVTENMSRKTRAYLVFDSELRSLTILDAAVGLCTTIFMFSLAVAVSAVWSLKYSPQEAMTPEGKFGWGWATFWFAVCAVTMVTGIGSLWWRKQAIDRIKLESFPQP